ncbi:MAG: DUF6788 family protein [Gammaproteobacteria bacterium]
MTGLFFGDTLTVMEVKETVIAELAEATQSMVQGSLSEVTRQCGDLSCACASDPARRHGPHLYLNFRDAGKARSVYVPAKQNAVIKDAQRAWLRFQEIGTALAADNRERFLRALQRDKQLAKARRATARRKAGQ